MKTWRIDFTSSRENGAQIGIYRAVITHNTTTTATWLSQERQASLHSTQISGQALGTSKTISVCFALHNLTTVPTIEVYALWRLEHNDWAYTTSRKRA